MPKRDRYGLHARIEEQLLSCLNCSIKAAYSSPQKKLPLLLTLKTEVEVIKRLVRISYSLEVIPKKHYITVQKDLRTVSKMATGWLKHTRRRTRKRPH